MQAPTMKSLPTTIACIAIGMIILGGFSLSAQAQTPRGEEAFGTPESVVKELYRAISVAPGTIPDWDAMRALFIDEAVVVALEGAVRDTTLVMPLDDFIAFLVAFVESPVVQKNGFAERIIRMKPTFMGEMAHIVVLYEAQIPGSPDPPGRGIDSLQLVRRGSRWRIVSISNELLAPDAPLPEALRQ